MNRRIRLYAAVTLVALFVAGCSGPCDTSNRSTHPRRRAAAPISPPMWRWAPASAPGGQSGGLVDTHQAHVLPGVLRAPGRRALHLHRHQPAGIPALLHLVSLSGPVMSNEGRTRGPRELDQARPTPTSPCRLDPLRRASTARYSSAPRFSVILRGQGSCWIRRSAWIRPSSPSNSAPTRSWDPPCRLGHAGPACRSSAGC